MDLYRGAQADDMVQRIEQLLKVREEPERRLTAWVAVTQDRDARVRAAVAAGISKHRVHQITGIGRSTIDRILAAAGPTGPSMGHQWAI